MSELLDSHIHLFDGGYGGDPTLASWRLDDARAYEQYRKLYGIAAALVVAYEGQPWAAGNNAFVAGLARQHPWIIPLAYVHRPERLTVVDLERWAREGFAGLSFYVFEPAECDALAGAADEVWAWLAARRWLISVNSRGTAWEAWRRVLHRHIELRLLVSHLGLPPAVAEPLDDKASTAAMAPVCALAAFPNVHVKLSGFYALAKPGHDYPHAAAWPYVRAALEAFGTNRLLWGSDFSPCLLQLSMAQTFGLFRPMPLFTDADRQRILGANLRALVEQVVRDPAAR